MTNTPSYDKRIEMQYDRFIKVALHRELKWLLRVMKKELIPSCKLNYTVI